MSTARGPAPELSVIVVSYQTRELTLACLRSLLAETSAPAFEVLVVDNASKDGSAAAIAAEFPEIDLIALAENVGFGVANNLAAERARGRRLLLLNPDTEVRGRALEALWAFAERAPEAGLWGGRTTHADGCLNPSSCWGAPTPWSALCLALGLASLFPRSALMHPEGLGAWRRDSEREVAIVSGCFLLIERGLWEQLDGFDPAFFMYGEDADLCLRARALGARPRITPDATIVHLGGASEHARADKLVRLFRAKAQLYRRYWGPAAGRFGVITLDLWAASRALLFTLAGIVSPGRRAARDAWREVWRRRGQWRRGGRNARRRRRVLAVASGGGHWVQLMRIMPAFEGHEVAFVTVRPEYAKDVGECRLHVVRDANLNRKCALVVTALGVLWAVLRERPTVVVSTGAAPGWFALVFGKLLGARTVWIDSLANAERLSKSGQRAKRWADLWLTQWPELARAEGPHYGGSVL